MFRICHIANFEWHLTNGLVCQNSSLTNPRFVSIGNKDLITRRRTRQVSLAPGGTLSDYIPFYFTPYSIMLYNIKTGYNGIEKRNNGDIIIFVSSMHRLMKNNIKVLFTDRHAYMLDACYYDDIKDLNKVDWKILAARDFKRDNDDPGKTSRYQAEILVHKAIPVNGLLCVACYNEQAESRLTGVCQRAGIKLEVLRRSGWYF